MLVQIPISKKHKIELVDIEVNTPEKIQIKQGDMIKILFQEKFIEIPYNQDFINQMEYDLSDTCMIEIYKNSIIIDKAKVNPIKVLSMLKSYQQ